MDFKKFLLSLFLFFIVSPFNLFTSTANAKVEIYEGEGLFAVVDETLDYAKNQAKLDAERNIAEQIFFDVQSSTEVKNSELVRDEIISTTESLMKILDVKYKIEPAEDSFIVHAVVTAEIDSDEIEKLLKNREENK